MINFKGLAKSDSPGEGRLGCILWLSFACVCFMIAYQVLPAKMAAMQLEDYMQELAMSHPRKPSGYFEKEIYLKSKQLDIMVKRDDIKVKKYPERVVMQAEFTKEINLFSFKYNWRFKIKVDRDIFLI